MSTISHWYILLLFQDLIQDPTLYLVNFLLRLFLFVIFPQSFSFLSLTFERQQEVILYNVPKFVVFWWLEWHYTFWKEHHSVSQGVHDVKIPIICVVYFDHLVKVHSARFLPLYLFSFPLCKYVCWGRCFETMQIVSPLTFAPWFYHSSMNPVCNIYYCGVCLIIISFLLYLLIGILL